MQKLIVKAPRLFLVTSLMVMLLAGCVTTQKGGIHESKPVDEIVAARVHAAKQYLQRRDFESAKRHLKIALEMDPRSADVHDALALTFDAIGELDLAKKHYLMALDYSGGGSRFRTNYANYLFQMGEFKAAEGQLLVVADDSLYERRESALFLLGLTQLQLLQLDNARQSFERALVLNPSNRRVLRELAIMNYDAGNFKPAWQYFQQYRRYNSKPSAEMLLLGIELASELGEQDAEASYILALKNIYPESREYKSFLRDQDNKRRR